MAAGPGTWSKKKVCSDWSAMLGADPETLEPRLLAYLSRNVFSIALFLSAKGKEPGSFFDIADRVLIRLASGIDPDGVQRHRRRAVDT